MSTFEAILQRDSIKSLTNVKSTHGLNKVSTELTVDKSGKSDDDGRTVWDVTIVLEDSNVASVFKVEELEMEMTNLFLRHLPISSDDGNVIGKIDFLYTTKAIVERNTALFDATKKSAKKEKEITSNATTVPVSNNEGEEEMPAEAHSANVSASVSNDEGGGGKMPAKTTAVFECDKKMPAKKYNDTNDEGGGGKMPAKTTAVFECDKKMPAKKRRVGKENNMNSPIGKKQSTCLTTAPRPRRKTARASIVTIDGKKFARATNGGALKPLARGVKTPIRKKKKLVKKLPIHD